MGWKDKLKKGLDIAKEKSKEGYELAKEKSKAYVDNLDVCDICEKKIDGFLKKRLISNHIQGRTLCISCVKEGKLQLECDRCGTEYTPQYHKQKEEIIPFCPQCEEQANLIAYVKFIVENTSITTRKYTNKKIDLDWLAQEIKDYFHGPRKTPEVRIVKYDDITSLINDECFVVLKGDSNNLLLKVHVPVDLKNIKGQSKGGLITGGIAKRLGRDILYGRKPVWFDIASSIDSAILDNSAESQKTRIIMQANKLEVTIAKEVDELVKSKQAVIVSGESPNTASNKFQDSSNQESNEDKREEKPSEDPIEKIKKLAELKEMGIISEEEFEVKKKKLMDSI